MMEVILLEDVRNLGKLGDKVKVKPGYGRNYLLKGRAERVTPANIAKFEARRAELEKAAAEKLATAQTRAEALEALVVEVSARAAEEGKLYGSITVGDLASAITKAGIDVVKSEISLPNGPIRTTGSHDVVFQLHNDVMFTKPVIIIEDK